MNAEHFNRKRAKGLLALALILFFVGAGIFVTFYPTIFSGFNRLQTDPGDSRSLQYRMEHIFKWLSGDPNHASLWDPPIFYPNKNTLAYSDTLLTVAPIYVFWRLLGFSSDMSFTLWMISICIINYAIALYLLYKIIGFDWLAAGFGAYIIAFGNSRIAQLGHQQLLCYAYILLCISALFIVFRSEADKPSELKRRIWIAVFFLSFAAQFYASFYNGYYLFLVLLIAAALSISLRDFRTPFLRFLHSEWKTLAIGLALTGILLLPLAYHYALTARDLDVHGPGSDRYGLPRLASYLWMGADNLLYSWMERFSLFRDLPLAYEHQMGLGLVTAVILCWFFWRFRDRSWVKLMLLITVTAFVAFTWFPGRIRLWRIWYYTLPGIQGIRIMSRFWILLLIPAGVALAAFIQHNRRRSKSLIVFSVLIALLCCLEQARSAYSYDRSLIQKRVNLIRQQINSDCEAIFVSSTNKLDPDWLPMLDSMWASMLQGVPTITAYSGKFPDNDAINHPVIRDPADFERIDAAIDQWCLQKNLERNKICWIRLELPQE